MGIPIPTKRDKTLSPKYSGRSYRSHTKREGQEIVENELPPPNYKLEDARRSPEVSRMGNYFNIVIAPPPIKALQPRKILQSDAYRPNSKRM